MALHATRTKHSTNSRVLLCSLQWHSKWRKRQLPTHQTHRCCWHYTPESLSATPHAAASAAPAAHQLPVHLNVNQSLCSTYFVTLNSKNQITIMDKCVDRPSKNSENINFSRYLGWLHCSLRSIVWYEADKSNQKTHRFASQQNVEELAVVLVSCIAQQEAAARVHTRAGAHMHNRYQRS